MSDVSTKPKISHRKKARNLLVQAVYQWQLAGSSQEDIEAEFRAHNTGKVEWEFFHEVFVFVLGKSSELDDLFTPFLDRDITKLGPIELAILRLGTYELQKRIDVPYKVVINEYVDLAKTYGATDGHKYINGVLDKSAQQLRSVEINAKK